jgi:hypothetical protein
MIPIFIFYFAILFYPNYNTGKKGSNCLKNISDYECSNRSPPIKLIEEIVFVNLEIAVQSRSKTAESRCFSFDTGEK